MKQFTVTITFTLSADNSQEAYDIGVAACEHLADTFNDDGSISAEFEVSVQEVAGGCRMSDYTHRSGQAYATQDAAERAHDRDRRERILSALMKFARQRPGIDPRNYFETWRESEGVKAYRQEVREVTADLADLREIMRSIRWRDGISADGLIKATRAYSGRLQIMEDGDRATVEYCTGQYFPTEYRKAACAVLASALWDYQRSICADVPDRGDVLRARFAREFSRRVARRYFN